MTTDKASGKTAQLKSLLMRAWRERWTASQYATQVKTVLGRVSGDVYGLAELAKLAELAELAYNS